MLAHGPAQGMAVLVGEAKSAGRRTAQNAPLSTEFLPSRGINGTPHESLEKELSEEMNTVI